MKNITLSVDEAVLSAARRHAVERNTTVNALVRRFLADIADRDDRGRKAREQIRRLSDRSTGRMDGRDWTREDLHER